MKNCLITLIFGLFFSLGFSLRVLAMESQQYEIQSEEVIAESSAPDDQNAGRVVLNSIDQAGFDKNGYIVSSDSSSSLSMAVDETNLSFGSLPQTKPATTSEAIHLSATNGYELNLSQSRPLSSLAGGTLPSTECDKACSAKHASPWINAQAYGLGYTLRGVGRPEDFLTDGYFRAIADSSKNQAPEPIFKVTSSTESPVDSQIIFKLNPPSEATDNYSTIITIDALPTY